MTSRIIVLLVPLAMLAGGCLNLRDDPPEPCDLPDADPVLCKSTNPARPPTNDAGAIDRPTPGVEPTETPAEPPATDPACQAGFHKCDNVCKDSRNPLHCGIACSPCPSIGGGQATCDGIKCNVTCPPDKKACPSLNSCIGLTEPCEGTCPAGQNPCNGACVPANDPTRAAVRAPPVRPLASARLAAMEASAHWNATRAITGVAMSANPTTSRSRAAVPVRRVPPPWEAPLCARTAAA
jgi:hypothetical protein